MKNLNIEIIRKLISSKTIPFKKYNKRYCYKSF